MGPEQICTCQKFLIRAPEQGLHRAKVSRPRGPCYGFSPRRCHCCPVSGASPCSKRQWPRRMLAWHPFHAEYFIPAEHEHGSAGGDGGIRARGGYRIILRGGGAPPHGGDRGCRRGGGNRGGSRAPKGGGAPQKDCNERKRSPLPINGRARHWKC